MIAKDEEDLIGMALKSVLNWVDEIVVVDTGSKDRTISIATEHGARVINHAWDGFSPSRNRALAECTSDWIFVLDADEQVDKNSGKLIRELIEAPRDRVYRVTQIDRLPGYTATQVPVVRLFPRSTDLRFEGKVHERLKTSDKFKKLASPILVNHWLMPSDIDPRGKKQQWYKSLMYESLRDNPNDPEISLRIALVEIKNSNIDTAFEFARQAHRNIRGDAVYLPILGLVLSHCYAAKGNWKAALDACNEYISNSQRYPALLYQRGVCQLRLQMWEEATSSATECRALADSYIGDLPLDLNLKILASNLISASTKILDERRK